MACRLFNAKLLFEPYFASDHGEQITVKFESKYYNFQEKELKMSSAKQGSVLYRPKCSKVKSNKVQPLKLLKL